LAGRQNSLDVTYDLLIPREIGEDFDTVFGMAASSGYQGVNVTYPYKERAAGMVVIENPLVRAMGAVNTVVFDKDGPRGFNTDYSGFIAAYRHVRGESSPGTTLMIGAGGVGRAVAFALIALGVPELRIADHDIAKAKGLTNALRVAGPAVKATIGQDAQNLATGAAGLINCTPVGMVGYDGTPLPPARMAGAEWAVDAVYTPVDTEFLRGAAAEGLKVISGYELFIGQGVDAWNIFTGLPLNVAHLRASLATPE
jgi:shikimate dehydrogenase